MKRLFGIALVLTAAILVIALTPEKKATRSQLNDWQEKTLAVWKKEAWKHSFYAYGTGPDGNPFVARAHARTKPNEDVQTEAMYEFMFFKFRSFDPLNRLESKNVSLGGVPDDWAKEPITVWRTHVRIDGVPLPCPTIESCAHAQYLEPALAKFKAAGIALTIDGYID